MLKKNVTITQSVREEFIGDLLDEARSFIGRAEKALAESRLESSIICLRLGAVKLAEVLLYKEKEDKINFTYLWDEIQASSLPYDFKKLFVDIQGFKLSNKRWLVKNLKELKAFLPKLG